MNILHITFDYADIVRQKKDGNFVIGSTSRTLRGTGIVETTDDLYLIKNKLATIITIAGSRYEQKSRYYHEEGFYIIRDKRGNDKMYYDQFIGASDEKIAKNVLLKYNEYLLNKSIKSIADINKRRKKIGLQRIKIDLIITPTSWFTIDSCLRLRDLLHVPLVSTLHVNEEELQKIDAFKLPWVDLILQYDSITKSCSDGVIAKNETILGAVNNYTSNCVEINNDIEFPGIFDKDMIRSFSVVYVGRLSFEKGLDRLYSIALLLKNSGIDLHIYGKTLGLDLKVETLFNKIVSLDNVTYHGHVNKRMLGKALNKSKILILPSRTEAFNQVILEGGYFGCVPLSTNVGSAEKCLNEQYIVSGASEEEIVKSFYAKITYFLKNYNSPMLLGLHKDFKKYAGVVNKQKRYLYFKQIIDDHRKSSFKKI